MGKNNYFRILQGGVLLSRLRRRSFTFSRLATQCFGTIPKDVSLVRFTSTLSWRNLKTALHSAYVLRHSVSEKFGKATITTCEITFALKET